MPYLSPEKDAHCDEINKIKQNLYDFTQCASGGTEIAVYLKDKTAADIQEIFFPLIKIFVCYDAIQEQYNSVCTTNEQILLCLLQAQKPDFVEKILTSFGAKRPYETDENYDYCYGTAIYQKALEIYKDQGGKRGKSFVEGLCPEKQAVSAQYGKRNLLKGPHHL